jgi:hypothetical protein
VAPSPLPARSWQSSPKRPPTRCPRPYRRGSARIGSARRVGTPVRLKASALPRGRPGLSRRPGDHGDRRRRQHAALAPPPRRPRNRHRPTGPRRRPGRRPKGRMWCSSNTRAWHCSSRTNRRIVRACLWRAPSSNIWICPMAPAATRSRQQNSACVSSRSRRRSMRRRSGSASIDQGQCGSRVGARWSARPAGAASVPAAGASGWMAQPLGSSCSTALASSERIGTLTSAGMRPCATIAS